MVELVQDCGLSLVQVSKQYLEYILEDSTTFLQGTVNRFKDLANFKTPYLYVMNNIDLLVAEQIRKNNSKASGILLEPIGRNTAPAIAVALKAREILDDPILLVYLQIT